jgi:hypothetical protein
LAQRHAAPLQVETAGKEDEPTLKLLLLLLLSGSLLLDAIRLAAWAKISRAWVMLFLTRSANLISSGNSYSYTHPLSDSLSSLLFLLKIVSLPSSWTSLSMLIEHDN